MLSGPVGQVRWGWQGAFEQRERKSRRKASRCSYLSTGVGRNDYSVGLYRYGEGSAASARVLESKGHDAGSPEFRDIFRRLRSRSPTGPGLPS